MALSPQMAGMLANCSILTSCMEKLQAPMPKGSPNPGFATGMMRCPEGIVKTTRIRGLAAMVLRNGVLAGLPRCVERTLAEKQLSKAKI
jgi:hypothetical protein